MSVIDFYRNKPNPSGYLFEDILLWKDEDWEFTHDFIQWVFPTSEESAFNPDAPVLTEEEILEFRRDPFLRLAVIKAWYRFIRFLGFAPVPNLPELEIVLAQPEKRVFDHANHNWLRITRCLLSLKLIQMDGMANVLFKALSDLYESGTTAISENTFNYWKNAIEGNADV